MFEVFGKKIETMDDLVDAIYEDMDEDFEMYQCFAYDTMDIDDIHDMIGQWVEEDDYEEFNSLLEENRDSFEGLLVEPYEDPNDEILRDYYNTRL